MNPIYASGKAVLSGEYAVLWGGAAIALPVGRASARRVSAADPAHVRVTLQPFGLHLAGARSSGRLNHDLPDAVARGFAALWNCALDLWGPPAELGSCDFELDTSQLYRSDGTKWGWGSSGAAKALLVRLWFAQALDAATAHTHVRELERATGAAGSGIDSAVALAGTALHFTMQGFRQTERRGEQGYWIALPQSIKTEARVSTVLQTVAAGDRRALLDSARHAATAYHLSPREAWLGTLAAYDQLLDAVLAPLGLARFDKHVSDIQDKVGPGWYVRPSGAGGDGVLALPVHDHAVLPELEQPMVPLTI